MRLDLGWTLVRVATGTTIFYHGAQKMFGWFGGPGFNATMEMMSNGFPSWLVALAIISECLGGLGLIFGFLTRLSGFGVFCTMMVASNGHFVKDVGGFAGLMQGSQAIGMFAHPFLIGMVALAMVISGGGRLSLDALWKLDQKLFRIGKTPEVA